ncbi:hypothetical protein C8R45DRAFT_807950 [Mycena sanguinolenta]|nr:hypothetical protein C8R45DRAFT_807950 [Mycena sanguinolenta]
MATSPEKTTDFARLFQLFEMLATRRSRMAATGSTSLDDTHAIPIPAELEPVFRSLATVIPPRQPPPSHSGRARRNTVAALGRTKYLDSDSDNDSDSDSDVESVAKFPLGKAYTFTFKMMIHKLYQVDEWAQKVRDVLERSQIEYKPLAERQDVKKADAPAVAPVSPEPGRVHFKAEVTIGGKKTTMPLAASRARRNSNDDARAVKKRCIGRRKSVSGPLSPASPAGEGWIYDAAISSAEVRERVRVETTPTFVPIIRSRPRYQSLESGNKKLGFGSRRIVSAAVDNTNVGAEGAPRTSTKRRL